MKSMILTAAVAAMVAMTGLVNAAEHEVQMLNRGEKGAMVFEPDVVIAAPGDTIRFIPTDRTHNVEAIANMIPEGAEVFRSAINEDFTVTLTEEGVYGVKCTPHYAMGMVMAIVVGGADNLDELKAVRHPGMARTRFEQILAGVPAE